MDIDPRSKQGVDLHRYPLNGRNFEMCIRDSLNKVAISCCSQNSLFRLWKAKSALSSDNCPQHDFLFMCPLRNTQKAVRRLHLTRTPRRRTDRRACWKAFRKICAAVLVKYDRTDSANFVVKLIISQYRPKYKSLSALKLRCGVSMIRT